MLFRSLLFCIRSSLSEISNYCSYFRTLKLFKSLARFFRISGSFCLSSLFNFQGSGVAIRISGMEVYFNTSVPACQVVFWQTLVYQAFCCSLSCDSFDIIPQQNGDVNTKFSIFLNFFHGNFCQQYIVFSLHGAYNFWTVFCIFLRLKQKLCLNVAGE